jgi:hypothetical protein
MEKFEFDRIQIEEIFKKAESSLLNDKNIHWLTYEASLTCLNSSEIISKVQRIPIVYCIWIWDGSEPTPFYVGHSSASLSRQRLINHFVKKDPRTGSQLERVKQAVSEGKQIGVSFLKIEPDYMRKPLEEWLILRNREKLIWNIHGKGKLI